MASVPHQATEKIPRFQQPNLFPASVSTGFFSTLQQPSPGMASYRPPPGQKGNPPFSVVQSLPRPQNQQVSFQHWANSDGGCMPLMYQIPGRTSTPKINWQYLTSPPSYNQALPFPSAPLAATNVCNEQRLEQICTLPNVDHHVGASTGNQVYNAGQHGFVPDQTHRMKWNANTQLSPSSYDFSLRQIGNRAVVKAASPVKSLVSLGKKQDQDRKVLQENVPFTRQLNPAASVFKPRTCSATHFVKDQWASQFPDLKGDKLLLGEELMAECSTCKDGSHSEMTGIGTDCKDTDNMHRSSLIAETDHLICSYSGCPFPPTPCTSVSIAADTSSEKTIYKQAQCVTDYSNHCTQSQNRLQRSEHVECGTEKLNFEVCKNTSMSDNPCVVDQRVGCEVCEGKSGSKENESASLAKSPCPINSHSEQEQCLAEKLLSPEENKGVLFSPKLCGLEEAGTTPHCLNDGITEYSQRLSSEDSEEAVSFPKLEKEAEPEDGLNGAVVSPSSRRTRAAFSQECLLQEPQVEESLVQDSQVQVYLVQEPLVQESLVQESQVQVSLVQEPLVQESLVQDSQVQVSLVQEPLVQESQVQDSKAQERQVRMQNSKESKDLGTALSPSIVDRMRHKSTQTESIIRGKKKKAWHKNFDCNNVSQLQAEVCQLRAQLCLNELHRQCHGLEQDMSWWSSVFQPLIPSSTSGARNAALNQLDNLKQQIQQIEMLRDHSLKILRTGQELQKVPSFVVCLPNGEPVIPLTVTGKDFQSLLAEGEVEEPAQSVDVTVVSSSSHPFLPFLTTAQATDHRKSPGIHPAADNSFAALLSSPEHVSTVPTTAPSVGPHMFSFPVCLTTSPSPSLAPATTALSSSLSSAQSLSSALLVPETTLAVVLSSAGSSSSSSNLSFHTLSSAGGHLSSGQLTVNSSVLGNICVTSSSSCTSPVSSLAPADCEVLACSASAQNKNQSQAVLSETDVDTSVASLSGDEKSSSLVNLSADVIKSTDNSSPVLSTDDKSNRLPVLSKDDSSPVLSTDDKINSSPVLSADDKSNISSVLSTDNNSSSVLSADDKSDSLPVLSTENNGSAVLSTDNSLPVLSTDNSSLFLSTDNSSLVLSTDDKSNSSLILSTDGKNNDSPVLSADDKSDRSQTVLPADTKGSLQSVMCINDSGVVVLSSEEPFMADNISLMDSNTLAISVKDGHSLWTADEPLSVAAASSTSMSMDLAPEDSSRKIKDREARDERTVQDIKIVKEHLSTSPREGQSLRNLGEEVRSHDVTHALVEEKDSRVLEVSVECLLYDGRKMDRAIDVMEEKKEMPSCETTTDTQFVRMSNIQSFSTADVKKMCRKRVDMYAVESDSGEDEPTNVGSEDLSVQNKRGINACSEAVLADSKGVDGSVKRSAQRSDVVTLTPSGLPCCVGLCSAPCSVPHAVPCSAPATWTGTAHEDIEPADQRDKLEVSLSVGKGCSKEVTETKVVPVDKGRRATGAVTCQQGQRDSRKGEVGERSGATLDRRMVLHCVTQRLKELFPHKALDPHWLQRTAEEQASLCWHHLQSSVHEDGSVSGENLTSSVHVHHGPSSLTSSSLSLTPSTQSLTPSFLSLTPDSQSLTHSSLSLTPSFQSMTPISQSLTPSSLTPSSLSLTPSSLSLTPSSQSLTPSSLSLTPSCQSMTFISQSLTPSSLTPSSLSLTPSSLTPSSLSLTPSSLSLTPSSLSLTPSSQSLTPSSLSLTPSCQSMTSISQSLTPLIARLESLAFQNPSFQSLTSQTPISLSLSLIMNRVLTSIASISQKLVKTYEYQSSELTSSLPLSSQLMTPPYQLPKPFTPNFQSLTPTSEPLAFPTTPRFQPLALQTPSYESLAFQTPSSQPLAFQTSSSQPLAFQTPSSQPLAFQTSPGSQSIAFQTPSSQPLAFQTSPGSQSVAFQTPSSQSMAFQTSPSSQPLAFQTPRSQSLAIHMPSSQSAFQIPSSQSLAFQTPSSQPLAFQTPRSQSLAFQRPPSSQSLAFQIPSSPPLAFQTPSSKSLAFQIPPGSQSRVFQSPPSSQSLAFQTPSSQSLTFQTPSSQSLASPTLQSPALCSVMAPPTFLHKSAAIFPAASAFVDEASLPSSFLPGSSFVAFSGDSEKISCPENLLVPSCRVSVSEQNLKTLPRTLPLEREKETCALFSASNPSRLADCESSDFEAMGYVARVTDSLCSPMAGTSVPGMSSLAGISALSVSSMARTSASGLSSMIGTSAPGIFSMASTSAPSLSSVVGTSAPGFSTIGGTSAPGLSSMRDTLPPGFSSMKGTSAPGLSTMRVTLPSRFSSMRGTSAPGFSCMIGTEVPGLSPMMGSSVPGLTSMIGTSVPTIVTTSSPVESDASPKTGIESICGGKKSSGGSKQEYTQCVPTKQDTFRKELWDSDNDDGWHLVSKKPKKAKKNNLKCQPAAVQGKGSGLDLACSNKGALSSGTTNSQRSSSPKITSGTVPSSSLGQRHLSGPGSIRSQMCLQWLYGSGSAHKRQGDTGSGGLSQLAARNDRSDTKPPDIPAAGCLKTKPTWSSIASLNPVDLKLTKSSIQEARQASSNFPNLQIFSFSKKLKEPAQRLGTVHSSIGGKRSIDQADNSASNRWWEQVSHSGRSSFCKADNRAGQGNIKPESQAVKRKGFMMTERTRTGESVESNASKTHDTRINGACPKDSRGKNLAYRKLCAAIEKAFPHLKLEDIHKVIIERKQFHGGHFHGKLFSDIIKDIQTAVLQQYPETPQHEETEAEECSICMMEFGSVSGFRLDCGHTFHKQCIDQWAQAEQSCPLCRKPGLMPEDFS